MGEDVPYPTLLDRRLEALHSQRKRGYLLSRYPLKALQRPFVRATEAPAPVFAATSPPEDLEPIFTMN